MVFLYLISSFHRIPIILKDFADVMNTPVFSAVVDMVELKKDFEEMEEDLKSFEYPRNIPGNFFLIIKNLIEEKRIINS